MALELINRDPWETQLISLSASELSQRTIPGHAEQRIAQGTLVKRGSPAESWNRFAPSTRGRTRNDARARAEGPQSALTGATGYAAPTRRRQCSPYGLTQTELCILALLTEGLSNLGIAKRRGLKEGTVKVHLSTIYRKLGVQSRVQAATIAQRIKGVQEARYHRSSHPQAVLEWLLPYVTSERRRAGEILFKRGDAADCLYFLHKGRVTLGELHSTMEEGELFGEVGVFSRSNVRTSSARCETDAVLFKLSAEQAKRICFENAQIGYHMMQLVTDRVARDRQG